MARKVQLTDTFNVAKSFWSDSDNFINAVQNTDDGTRYSFEVKGIDSQYII